MLPRAVSIAANLRAKFDHRLMHLRLGVLLQNHFAVGKNLLNARAQPARFRIDNLKLFLDPECENLMMRAPFSSLYQCSISGSCSRKRTNCRVG
jgi:hypothetical protein